MLPHDKPWYKRPVMIGGGIGGGLAAILAAIFAANHAQEPDVQQDVPPVTEAPPEAPAVQVQEQVPATTGTTTVIALPADCGSVDACKAENALICPSFYRNGKLAPVANWAEVAATNGWLCSDSKAAANGATSCGSSKYAGLDCLAHNGQPAGKPLDPTKPVRSDFCVAQTLCREGLNVDLVNACTKYCAGETPEPGYEPCVDHLKAIRSTLDITCLAALDAHEAAKPTK